jgi:hypothetical protein
VSSSSAGASLPRLLVFRTPTMLKTRIAATTTLSRVLHLGLIQGTRKRLRIGAPTPKERVSRHHLLVVRAYNPPLNIFLEVCVRHVGVNCCGKRYRRRIIFLTLQDEVGDWNKKAARNGLGTNAARSSHVVSPTGRTCNRGGLARWRASRRPRDAPGGPDLGESYANTGGFQHLLRLT